jgi:hypothetical protein
MIGFSSDIGWRPDEMALSSLHARKAPFHRASRACTSEMPILRGKYSDHIACIRRNAGLSNNAIHSIAHIAASQR